ncbi:MAG TPA: hypothetical protein VFR39_08170 [Burkholderiales bacterium]|nr:hypothetical protein [Burkholderiales bacterium]
MDENRGMVRFPGSFGGHFSPQLNSPLAALQYCNSTSSSFAAA